MPLQETPPPAAGEGSATELEPRPEDAVSDTGAREVLRVSFPDSSFGRLLEFPVSVVRNRLADALRAGVVSFQEGPDGSIDLIVGPAARKILEEGGTAQPMAA